MSDSRVILNRRMLVLGAAATALTGLPASAVASADRSQQSPIGINLDAAQRESLPALDFDYPGDATVTMKYIREDAAEPQGCSVRGVEETVRAELAPGTASLTVGGATYGLAQFHWHTPSEHLFEGKAYPIEMHFVHQDAAGNTVVVGVWVRQGPANDTLGRLYDHLVAECAPFEDVSNVDLEALKPRQLTSYRYAGSLTTSPYSEGVQWIILAGPITASQRQIDQFRHVFPDGNRRDIQDINGRLVLTDL